MSIIKILKNKKRKLKKKLGNALVEQKIMESFVVNVERKKMKKMFAQIVK